MATANTNSTKSIDELNNLLQGEISAVETYRIALEKLTDGGLRDTLDACLRSHSQRVDVLKQKVIANGGVPTETSGAWGVFARSAETVSASLGDKNGVATLENGEDHGLKSYQVDTDKLTAEARSVINNDLLPLQLETHRIISMLKKQQTPKSV